MKRLYVLALLLYSSLTLAQQMTTVTATITDPSSQAFVNGNVQANYIRPSGYGSTTPYSNGVPIQEHGITATMNGSGQFTLSLADLSTITPAGGTWSFTLCPAVSSNCPVATSNAVQGASVDLSSQLSAQVPPIVVNPNSPLARSYNNNEIVIHTPGIEWLDIISNQLKYVDANGNIVVIGTGSGGIAELIAGTNVTLSPSPCLSGDTCTINASGGSVGPGTATYLPVFTGPSAIADSVITSTFGSNTETINIGAGATGNSSVVIQQGYVAGANNNAGNIYMVGAPTTGSAAAGSANLYGGQVTGSSGAGAVAQITVGGAAANGFGNIGGSINILGGITSAANPGGSINLTPGTGGFGNGSINLNGSVLTQFVGGGNQFLGVTNTGFFQTLVPVTSLTGSTGITCTPATGAVTCSLNNQITAGTYTNPASITVNAQGQVTAIAALASVPAYAIQGGTGTTSGNPYTFSFPVAFGGTPVICIAVGDSGTVGVSVVGSPPTATTCTLQAASGLNFSWIAIGPP